MSGGCLAKTQKGRGSGFPRGLRQRGEVPCRAPRPAARARSWSRPGPAAEAEAEAPYGVGRPASRYSGRPRSRARSAQRSRS
ncbi:hypothetical protein GCM10009731_21310 [Streptomyces globosus]